MLNASLLCRVGRLRVSRSHGVPAVELPGLRRTKTTTKWTSKDTTRKCLSVAGAGEVVGCWHTWAVPVRRGVCRVRGHGRASRPSRLEIRASGFTVGPGLGPGHPASGAPVDLSSCAPRDRTIALTSWSSRQRTYVRARRPPRGLGLGPGGRLSTVRANARLSLFAWGPIAIQLNFGL